MSGETPAGAWGGHGLQTADLTDDDRADFYGRS